MQFLEKLRLRLEIEDFYTREADLLDRREFELWLDTLAEDLSYRMPLVRNMQVRDIEREYVEEPNSIAWIDQDKELVTSRVAQIRTGVHWAEEPLSRTVHVTTNILILGIEEMADAAEEIDVHSKFIILRARNEDEEDLVIGRREDRLRRTGHGWHVARRRVLLPQKVLLSPTLSFFI